MNIVTSSSFHIGEQHIKQGKPCQDYVLSEVLPNETAIAVVSDGCSSGGMTDIGSRLMSLATMYALKMEIRDCQLNVSNITAARDSYLESYRATLHLETRDLLATCLFATVDSESALVHVTGDGTIAFQYEKGLVIETFNWEKNTPYYPAYRIGGLSEAFTKGHGEEPEPFTQITIIDMGDEYENSVTETSYSTEEGVAGININKPLNDENMGQLKTVALFSDGVDQVDGVVLTDVIKKLLAFKNGSGQFAVRRMNRFLREIKKHGNGPIDDIAYAVIKLN